MLHLVVNKALGTMKVFLGPQGAGELLRVLPCGTAGTAGSQRVRYGSTPTGEYLIGKPSWVGEGEDVQSRRSFGRVFLPVTGGDVPGRSGFGVHGGGGLSLEDSWNSMDQNGDNGLRVTHGCIRLANHQAVWLAGVVEALQATGHRTVLTVVAS